MNSEMIEEFVWRVETFGGWDRSDLEEIYQEGFDAGKKAALQWQPIETAPKDGRKILVLAANIETAHYINESGGLWCTYDQEYRCSAHNPTHWMPLPPVPEVE